MVIKIKATTDGGDAKPQDARMGKLTARQQEIFVLIEQSIIRTGYPPTRAEIATSLGFRSVNAAEEHLQALARKGVIELTPGASRGIRLVHAVAQPMLPTPLFTAPAYNASKASISHGMASMAQLAMSRALALPLIGRVAAGLPMLAQEHVDRVYQVESSLFSKQPDYLLTVHGMSMRDAGILDGDLLAVKQAKDAVNGQIVVARIDNEVTVKRFKRRGAVIELQPENPDFKTIVVDERGGEFELEGIAVGLIRNTPLM